MTAVSADVSKTFAPITYKTFAPITYSFTFTGDGAGGAAPTSGCYEQDEPAGCLQCLQAWWKSPPNPEYTYNAIVAHGCAGKQVDCDDFAFQCPPGITLHTYNVTGVAHVT